MKKNRPFKVRIYLKKGAEDARKELFESCREVMDFLVGSETIPEKERNELMDAVKNISSKNER